VVAQEESVSQSLERKSVLCHAGKPGEVGAAAQGNEQLVVREIVVVRVAWILKGNLAVFGIDGLNFGFVEVSRTE
jgi:hypothetical protein